METRLMTILDLCLSQIIHQVDPREVKHATKWETFRRVTELLWLKAGHLYFVFTPGTRQIEWNSPGSRCLSDDNLHPRVKGKQLRPPACLHLLCHIYGGDEVWGGRWKVCESGASSKGNITSCIEVPGWVPPSSMGSFQCGFHKKSLAIKRQRWANPPPDTFTASKLSQSQALVPRQARVLFTSWVDCCEEY